MVDYPHASAACLCYLDEKEKGKGGGRSGSEGQTEGEKQRCRTLKCSAVDFFSLRPPAGASTLSCCPCGIGRQAGGWKKKREGRG